MRRARVSVLLPVHNAGRRLLLAVWSILAQSLEDFELLILDDASTDGALEALERIADPRLRVVRDSTHLGLAARLNRGIDLAHCDFIARMDADDVAYPARLQRQLEYLEHNENIDLLGTRALAFSGDGAVAGLLPFRQSHSDICRRPWLGFYLPHPTWMGRAQWFRNHRYRVPEPLRAEDQDLLLRSYSSSRFDCLPDVLLGYRIAHMSLGKSLTARLSVGRAQLRVHLRGRKPGLALLGAGASLAKAGLDVARAAAGRGLYTARSLDRPLDPEVSVEWSRLWRAANAWADNATR